MFHNAMIAVVLLICLVCSATANPGLAEFPDDYFEGFAQGVYYGLLLRDEQYEIAWCMKSELGYEARNLGTGEDFQRRLEGLLHKCRATATGEPPIDVNQQ
jgi:hypothetical protein